MAIFQRNKITKNSDVPALGEGTLISEETTNYVASIEDAQDREEDPTAWAADRLGEFTLAPGARSLMDRAVDNLSRNTGVGLEDQDARVSAQMRAAILDASGNDLNIAIGALTSECDPLEAPRVVHTLLFNVLKSAVFIANMDYRNFLDPKRDLDLHLYTGPRPQGDEFVDQDDGDPTMSCGEDGRDPGAAKFSPDRREDHSPLEGESGHTTHAEWQLFRMQELYGARIEAEEDVVPAALEDLRYFFQLTCESFGWDPNTPMPFAFTMEVDGTFTPINDPEAALDVAELRRQASRAKRRDKENGLYAAAAERARAALSKAAARK